MSRDKNSLPPDIEFNFKIADNSPLVPLPPTEHGFEFMVSKPFTNHADSPEEMSSIESTSFPIWQESVVIPAQNPENS